MDKIIEKANELKSALNDMAEFKEYLRLKELYDNNEEIKSLKLLMLRYKVGSKEYKAIESQYNNYPLVVNYLKAEEEVMSILRTIREILDK